MLATGEIIRMMNYADDITTTLRRIVANSPFITAEEKKRLAEYIRNADPSLISVLERLEKGE